MTRKNRSISKILIFAFLGAFLIYGMFELLRYFSGPRISVSEPKNGSEIATSTVILRGKARNISYLTLNGKQIFADTAGNFGQKLLLQEGYNIITIEAKDRFGKNRVQKVELYRLIEKEENFDVGTTTEDSASTTDKTTEEATTTVTN